ncbi:hypothetical protein MLD38_026424 [Melastoma candidum]|uniref:Uncharacterized protein n=1 Tax=Melastoma candidum TaxID=119954 RepID=A0ACB9P039_9MYRT|nr:hypothetical protein MLD38_026424 [Melastoma candidum]
MVRNIFLKYKEHQNIFHQRRKLIACSHLFLIGLNKSRMKHIFQWLRLQCSSGSGIDVYSDLGLGHESSLASVVSF